MALVDDFLTPREFGDQFGFVLAPVARDRTRAIGALNAREGWGLSAGTTYEELSVVQREAVDVEAQVYASAVVQGYIDSAVEIVSSEDRRPLLDRLVVDIPCFSPRDMKKRVKLSVSDFQRFPVYAESDSDSVYPFRYWRKDDVPSRGATGVLNAGDLFEGPDPIFPESVLSVFPSSGSWPGDLDTDKECYFSVYVGVSREDRRMKIWRQGVAVVSRALRGNEDGMPLPYQKTLRSILGRVQT